MGKIALFGGGGSIGHSIADALRAQGESYRVVGRSKAALEPDFGSDPLAEIVSWNPADPASVREAARGVETIVYMVGVPYTDFRLHPVLMKQTLDGAIAEGVNKLILIGTVYPYGRPRTTPVREDHPREPHTFKGRMRKEQEDLVLAAEGQRAIRAAVGRLRGRCPQIVTALMSCSDRTYQEISHELGISQGSLGPLRSRCLGCLRTILNSRVGSPVGWGNAR